MTTSIYDDEIKINFYCKEISMCIIFIWDGTEIVKSQQSMMNERI